MTQSRIAGTLQNLYAGWWSFFDRRCLVGFPWFWPARPPGLPAMVAARRIARSQFGRDHHFGYRVLAQDFECLLLAMAVMVQLCQVRHFRGSKAVRISTIPGAIWAASASQRSTGRVLRIRPVATSTARLNIDNYLYCREGSRLFKLLNRPTQPNPLDDKLAFHELCKKPRAALA